MSKQLINIGSAPNDDSGDNPRAAAIKINSNADELYANLPVDGIAFTAEDGDLTASTTVPLATFHLSRNRSWSDVFFGLTTAPAGSTATFDVHLNGTTIFSTKPTIDAGEKWSGSAATPAVLSTTSGSQGDLVEIFCDAVGASTAGAGGKCYILFNT